MQIYTAPNLSYGESTEENKDNYLITKVGENKMTTAGKELIELAIIPANGIKIVEVSPDTPIRE